MTVQPPSAPAEPLTRTSTNAIISLVAGLLGLTFLPLVGSIVAVIFGPMAKKEIFASGGALTGEGIATAGQILGWIGIGLSVIGLCVAGVMVVLPLCLVALGLGSAVRESSLLLWMILA